VLITAQRSLCWQLCCHYPTTSSFGYSRDGLSSFANCDIAVVVWSFDAVLLDIQSISTLALRAQRFYVCLAVVVVLPYTVFVAKRGEKVPMGYSP